MKKTLLILVFTLLFSSCKENKYGVINGLFSYPHFPKDKVEQTIIKELGCERCIKDIEYPTGYPIHTPRILDYVVVFEKNNELKIKRFYIGKVLSEDEDKKSNYLRLVE